MAAAVGQSRGRGRGTRRPWRASPVLQTPPAVGLTTDPCDRLIRSPFLIETTCPRTACLVAGPRDAPASRLERVARLGGGEVASKATLDRHAVRGHAATVLAQFRPRRLVGTPWPPLLPTTPPATPANDAAATPTDATSTIPSCRFPPPCCSCRSGRQHHGQRRV